MIQTYEDTLKWLGNTMVQSEDWQLRESASVKMITTLVKALKINNSYLYNFDSLNTIKIIKPEDNKFRIFTWQLTMKDKSYRYYGAIQMNNDALKLYPLIDMSMFIPHPEDTVLDRNNWWGCIYYNIAAQKIKKDKYYFLFGWDGYDPWSNKKVADVLWFDKNGEPHFGKNIFELDNNEMRSRIIIEYKEDANASINFDKNLNMIVFDFLRPENPMSEGIYSTYIPDGTYQGFKYEKGVWKLQREVFDDILDAPPIYKPKYEGEDPNQYIKN